MLDLGERGRRSTNIDLSVFRRGMWECGCGAGAALEVVDLSASPASRRKSTMSASAAFCLPTSDGVMRSPSAAVLLLAPDMEEADSNERLLDQRNERRIWNGTKESGREQTTRESGTHGM